MSGPRESVANAHSIASVLCRREDGVRIPTAFLSSLGRARITLSMTIRSVTSLAVRIELCTRRDLRGVNPAIKLYGHLCAR